jgi:NADPH2:quinone reductase
MMELEDVDIREPDEGEVLVRIRAAGVNPVDTYIRSGSANYTPACPYTPGTDGAGIIERTGRGVRRLREGQRVFVGGSATGTYAEMAICAESQAHALPPKVSFAQGAGVFVPYATAYHALFHKAHGSPEETVLVHGATGGVGSAAVQIAKAAGFTVIATGGTEQGRQMVKNQGAEHVLDHSQSGYLDAAHELTGGRGVDIILEMLANVNLGRDLGVLAKGGRVVVIGSRGPVEINPRDAMSRDATITGMLLANSSPREMEAIVAALEAGLESGVLSPVTGKELPLAEAAQAHRDVMAAGAYGKIVLIP